MTQAEVESLLGSDHVLAVREEKIYNLHTTRTPQFLGLAQINLRDGHSPEELNKASQDVIIGVLDTGVSTESESFRDDGMPERFLHFWSHRSRLVAILVPMLALLVPFAHFVALLVPPL
ncbi:hypothetical protein OROHE_000927 [Orobanche hederae]